MPPILVLGTFYHVNNPPPPPTNNSSLNTIANTSFLGNSTTHIPLSLWFSLLGAAQQTCASIHSKQQTVCSLYNNFTPTRTNHACSMLGLMAMEVLAIYPPWFLAIDFAAACTSPHSDGHPHEYRKLLHPADKCCLPCSAKITRTTASEHHRLLAFNILFNFPEYSVWLAFALYISFWTS